MKTYFQILIPKRNPFCAHCQKAFSNKEEMVSFLNEKEEEWLRIDLCTPCSSKHQEPSLTKWKSQFSKALVEIIEQPEAEKGFNLLQTLAISDMTEEQEEAFLLALFLVRKKKISEKKEVIEKDKKFFKLYEHIESGEALLVPQPTLAGFSIPEVQKRLKAKLG